MKKIFTAILFICFFSANASHYTGGQLSYVHLHDNTYKVTMSYLRDCTGINYNNSESILITSSSTAQSFTSTLNLSYKYYPFNNIQYVCCGCQTTSNCQTVTSNMPGFDYISYEGDITLPNKASDWIFTFIGSGYSNNFVNFSSIYNFTICTSLNNLISNNSSPQFNREPLLITPGNSTIETYNLNCYDLKGDFLSYHIDYLRKNNIYDTILYNPLFTLNNPINGNIFTLDTTTGTLVLNSFSTGQNLFCERIDQYKNGVLQSKTYRNIMLYSYTAFPPNPSNILPELNGINNTNSYIAHINPCSNGLTFNISSIDSNATDSTFITRLDSIPNLIFSVNNAQQKTATITWYPTLANISPVPYELILKVKDSHCAFKKTYFYYIYVDSCNTDTVWSGDANADYVVDNFDVLNIGIANGTSGIVRPNATTNWQAEFCPNWTNFFANGINYKHSDCNGDGIINTSDTIPITNNYGNIHFKQKIYGKYKTRGLPVLYFDKTGVVANQNSVINIPIKLGTLGTTMKNIYGIAATINVENISLSNAVSLNNSNSWLGSTTNSFLWQKNISNSELPFTIVRTNQNNITGQGTIATLQISIPNNAVVGKYFQLKFSDIKLIDSLGNEITDYNVINDSILIQSALSINTINKKSFSVHPNPVTNEMQLIFEKEMPKTTEVKIIDLMGKDIYKNTLQYLPTKGSNYLINTSNLVNGYYFIQINNNGIVENIKVLKE